MKKILNSVLFTMLSILSTSLLTSKQNFKTTLAMESQPSLTPNDLNESFDNGEKDKFDLKQKIIDAKNNILAYHDLFNQILKQKSENKYYFSNSECIIALSNFYSRIIEIIENLKYQISFTNYFNFINSEKEYIEPLDNLKKIYGDIINIKLKNEQIVETQNGIKELTEINDDIIKKVKNIKEEIAINKKEAPNPENFEKENTIKNFFKEYNKNLKFDENLFNENLKFSEKITNNYNLENIIRAINYLQKIRYETLYLVDEMKKYQNYINFDKYTNKDNEHVQFILKIIHKYFEFMETILKDIEDSDQNIKETKTNILNLIKQMHEHYDRLLKLYDIINYNTVGLFCKNEKHNNKIKKLKLLLNYIISHNLLAIIKEIKVKTKIFATKITDEDTKKIIHFNKFMNKHGDKFYETLRLINTEIYKKKSKKTTENLINLLKELKKETTKFLTTCKESLGLKNLYKRDLNILQKMLEKLKEAEIIDQSLNFFINENMNKLLYDNSKDYRNIQDFIMHNLNKLKYYKYEYVEIDSTKIMIPMTISIN